MLGMRFTVQQPRVGYALKKEASRGGGLARPWVVADIGGTNARFGWIADGSSVVSHVATLRVIDHAGPAAAARAYLTDLQCTLGVTYEPPRSGAFAVAAASGQDHVALVNSAWAFSCATTQRELGMDELLLLNDFEALALSLPRLGPNQVRAIAADDALRATPAAAGTLAVIGPGTGLGVAGLVPTRSGWVAIPGEGGHATLAAGNDFESDLLAAVRRDHPHVSAERLLSGIGLPVLHRAIAAVHGRPGEILSAERIFEQGLAGRDDLCSLSIDTFCALLGSFAGNVALGLGARGGVYIGGGIVPHLGERFFASQFRERFEAKGRLESYLRPIPTLLITDTLAALSGAALALEQYVA